ncbi:hypothetical protein BESB_066020 [Besnoitia besnoiti]|uniref:Leucine rich repeat-containing protein n=1 Tax=Besnoitia besnoiti TaxID=94643 RepID=A0A2A9M9I5_BESBE|nr:hypothetical protein BESB_066020 [Besnoitia besnoiti]PFH34569.1 hypothetical protein BESB_066020 [Besnoitia besnoiti]
MWGRVLRSFIEEDENDKPKSLSSSSTPFSPSPSSPSWHASSSSSSLPHDSAALPHLSAGKSGKLSSAASSPVSAVSACAETPSSPTLFPAFSSSSEGSSHILTYRDILQAQQTPASPDQTAAGAAGGPSARAGSVCQPASVRTAEESAAQSTVHSSSFSRSAGDDVAHVRAPSPDGKEQPAKGASLIPIDAASLSRGLDGKEEREKMIHVARQASVSLPPRRRFVYTQSWQRVQGEDVELIAGSSGTRGNEVSAFSSPLAAALASPPPVYLPTQRPGRCEIIPASALSASASLALFNTQSGSRSASRCPYSPSLCAASSSGAGSDERPTVLVTLKKRKLRRHLEDSEDEGSDIPGEGDQERLRAPCAASLFGKAPPSASSSVSSYGSSPADLSLSLSEEGRARDPQKPCTSSDGHLCTLQLSRLADASPAGAEAPPAGGDFLRRQRESGCACLSPELIVDLPQAPGVSIVEFRAADCGVRHFAPDFYASPNAAPARPEEKARDAAQQTATESAFGANVFLAHKPGKAAISASLALSCQSLRAVTNGFFSLLPALQVLDLRSNNLESVPESVACLRHLRILLLDGNVLSTVPRQLLDLPALATLSLSSNYLTHFPDRPSSFGGDEAREARRPGAGGGVSPLEKLHIESNFLDDLSFLLAPASVSAALAADPSASPPRGGAPAATPAAACGPVGGAEPYADLLAVHGQLFFRRLRVLHVHCNAFTLLPLDLYLLSAHLEELSLDWLRYTSPPLARVARGEQLRCFLAQLRAVQEWLHGRAAELAAQVEETLEHEAAEAASCSRARRGSAGRNVHNTVRRDEDYLLCGAQPCRRFRAALRRLKQEEGRWAPGEENGEDSFWPRGITSAGSPVDADAAPLAPWLAADLAASGNCSASRGPQAPAAPAADSAFPRACPCCLSFLEFVCFFSSGRESWECPLKAPTPRLLAAARHLVRQFPPGPSGGDGLAASSAFAFLLLSLCTLEIRLSISRAFATDAIFAVDAKRRTRLHVAALEGHEGVARALLRAGERAELNALDSDGSSPLLLAVRESQFNLVALLVEEAAVRLREAAAADAEAEKETGAREEVARGGFAPDGINLESAARLLPYRFPELASSRSPVYALPQFFAPSPLAPSSPRPVSSPSPLGGAPAAFSATQAAILSGFALLNAGAGIYGTPLHVATVSFEVAICALLLHAGCDPTAVDSDGNTALHVLLSVFDRGCPGLEPLLLSSALRARSRTKAPFPAVALARAAPPSSSLAGASGGGAASLRVSADSNVDEASASPAPEATPSEYTRVRSRFVDLLGLPLPPPLEVALLLLRHPHADDGPGARFVVLRGAGGHPGGRARPAEATDAGAQAQRADASSAGGAEDSAHRDSRGARESRDASSPFACAAVRVCVRANQLNNDLWGAVHLAARRGQRKALWFIDELTEATDARCQRGLCAHAERVDYLAPAVSLLDAARRFEKAAEALQRSASPAASPRGAELTSERKSGPDNGARAAAADEADARRMQVSGREREPRAHGGPRRPQDRSREEGEAQREASGEETRQLAYHVVGLDAAVPASSQRGRTRDREEVRRTESSSHLASPAPSATAPPGGGAVASAAGAASVSSSHAVNPFLVAASQRAPSSRPPSAMPRVEARDGGGVAREPDTSPSDARTPPAASPRSLCASQRDTRRPMEDPSPLLWAQLQTTSGCLVAAQATSAALFALVKATGGSELQDASALARCASGARANGLAGGESGRRERDVIAPGLLAEAGDVDILQHTMLNHACPFAFDLNLRGGTHLWTPLHLAAHAGNLDVVQQLLDSGANVCVLNRQRRACQAVARGQQQQAIERILWQQEQVDLWKVTHRTAKMCFSKRLGRRLRASESSAQDPRSLSASPPAAGRRSRLSLALSEAAKRRVHSATPASFLDMPARRGGATPEALAALTRAADSASPSLGLDIRPMPPPAPEGTCALPPSRDASPPSRRASPPSRRASPPSAATASASAAVSSSTPAKSAGGGAAVPDGARGVGRPAYSAAAKLNLMDEDEFFSEAVYLPSAAGPGDPPSEGEAPALAESPSEAARASAKQTAGGERGRLAAAKGERDAEHAPAFFGGSAWQGVASMSFQFVHSIIEEVTRSLSMEDELEKCAESGVRAAQAEVPRGVRRQALAEEERREVPKPQESEKAEGARAQASAESNAESRAEAEPSEAPEASAKEEGRGAGDKAGGSDERGDAERLCALPCAEDEEEAEDGGVCIADPYDPYERLNPPLFASDRRILAAYSGNSLQAASAATFAAARALSTPSFASFVSVSSQPAMRVASRASLCASSEAAPPAACFPPSSGLPLAHASPSGASASPRVPFALRCAFFERATQPLALIALDALQAAAVEGPPFRLFALLSQSLVSSSVAAFAPLSIHSREAKFWLQGTRSAGDGDAAESPAPLFLLRSSYPPTRSLPEPDRSRDGAETATESRGEGGAAEASAGRLRGADAALSTKHTPRRAGEPPASAGPLHKAEEAFFSADDDSKESAEDATGGGSRGGGVHATNRDAAARREGRQRNRDAVANSSCREHSPDRSRSARLRPRPSPLSSSLSQTPPSPSSLFSPPPPARGAGGPCAPHRCRWTSCSSISSSRSPSLCFSFSSTSSEAMSPSASSRASSSSCAEGALSSAASSASPSRLAACHSGDGSAASASRKEHSVFCPLRAAAALPAGGFDSHFDFLSPRRPPGCESEGEKGASEESDEESIPWEESPCCCGHGRASLAQKQMADNPWWTLVASTTSCSEEDAACGGGSPNIGRSRRRRRASGGSAAAQRGGSEALKRGASRRTEEKDESRNAEGALSAGRGDEAALRGREGVKKDEEERQGETRRRGRPRPRLPSQGGGGRGKSSDRSSSRRRERSLFSRSRRSRKELQTTSSLQSASFEQFLFEEREKRLGVFVGKLVAADRDEALLREDQHPRGAALDRRLKQKERRRRKRMEYARGGELRRADQDAWSLLMLAVAHGNEDLTVMILDTLLPSEPALHWTAKTSLSSRRSAPSVMAYAWEKRRALLMRTPIFYDTLLILLARGIAISHRLPGLASPSPSISRQHLLHVLMALDVGDRGASPLSSPLPVSSSRSSGSSLDPRALLLLQTNKNGVFPLLAACMEGDFALVSEMLLYCSPAVCVCGEDLEGRDAQEDDDSARPEEQRTRFSKVRALLQCVVAAVDRGHYAILLRLLYQPLVSCVTCSLGRGALLSVPCAASLSTLSLSQSQPLAGAGDAEDVAAEGPRRRGAEAELRRREEQVLLLTRLQAVTTALQRRDYRALAVLLNSGFFPPAAVLSAGVTLAFLVREQRSLREDETKRRAEEGDEAAEAAAGEAKRRSPQASAEGEDVGEPGASCSAARAMESREEDLETKSRESERRTPAPEERRDALASLDRRLRKLGANLLGRAKLRGGDTGGRGGRPLGARASRAGEPAAEGATEAKSKKRDSRTAEGEGGKGEAEGTRDCVAGRDVEAQWRAIHKVAHQMKREAFLALMAASKRAARRTAGDADVLLLSLLGAHYVAAISSLELCPLMQHSSSSAPPDAFPAASPSSCSSSSFLSPSSFYSSPPSPRPFFSPTSASRALDRTRSSFRPAYYPVKAEESCANGATLSPASAARRGGGGAGALRPPASRRDRSESGIVAFRPSEAADAFDEAERNKDDALTLQASSALSALSSFGDVDEEDRGSRAEGGADRDEAVEAAEWRLPVNLTLSASAAAVFLFAPCSSAAPPLFPFAAAVLLGTAALASCYLSCRDCGTEMAPGPARSALLSLFTSSPVSFASARSGFLARQLLVPRASPLARVEPGPQAALPPAPMSALSSPVSALASASLSLPLVVCEGAKAQASSLSSVFVLEKRQTRMIISVFSRESLGMSAAPPSPSSAACAACSLPASPSAQAARGGATAPLPSPAARKETKMGAHLRVPAPGFLLSQYRAGSHSASSSPRHSTLTGLGSSKGVDFRDGALQRHSRMDDIYLVDGEGMLCQCCGFYYCAPCLVTLESPLSLPLLHAVAAGRCQPLLVLHSPPAAATPRFELRSGAVFQEAAPPRAQQMAKCCGDHADDITKPTPPDSVINSGEDSRSAGTDRLGGCLSPSGAPSVASACLSSPSAACEPAKAASASKEGIVAESGDAAGAAHGEKRASFASALSAGEAAAHSVRRDAERRVAEGQEQGAPPAAVGARDAARLSARASSRCSSVSTQPAGRRHGSPGRLAAEREGAETVSVASSPIASAGQASLEEGDGRGAAAPVPHARASGFFGQLARSRKRKTPQKSAVSQPAHASLTSTAAAARSERGAGKPFASVRNRLFSGFRRTRPGSATSPRRREKVAGEAAEDGEHQDCARASKSRVVAETRPKPSRPWGHGAVSVTAESPQGGDDAARPRGEPGDEASQRWSLDDSTALLASPSLSRETDAALEPPNHSPLLCSSSASGILAPSSGASPGSPSHAEERAEGKRMPRRWTSLERLEREHTRLHARRMQQKKLLAYLPLFRLRRRIDVLRCLEARESASREAADPALLMTPDALAHTNSALALPRRGKNCHAPGSSMAVSRKTPSPPAVRLCVHCAAFYSMV